jgi:hypothetical protein
MDASKRHSRALRATFCEIERGLFYVTYPSHALEAELLELPTYGLGTCAFHVKQRMEESIRAFGYETVIWEDALVLPQSHSLAPAPTVSGHASETPFRKVVPPRIAEYGRANG